ncbi:clathrin adaptor, mu subunit [Agrocybe pediades]|nr:clathrin adaptor, mu subunit [Agrocybe pediades]
MGLDGLILLDSNGRSIIQSGFRSTSTAYPLLHIDAVNNALSKAPRPGDVDPVIYVNSYGIEDAPSACCHVQVADMRFLCPISGDVDPLFGFAFLQTFIDILHEYFGTLSSATLKENFDIVYQLLEETLDSGGHPLTTSPNALRDIVLPPSLLNKLLGVAGANFTATINSSAGHGASAGAFASPIPWRKAGLRYTSNEIFFDMVEELKAIVNRNGVPLTSNVYGKIETNSRLSGTPDCLLSFTNPHVLVDCAFHPCVRLSRWSRDKSFSFVPPDGKFILAEYRYSPNASSLSSGRPVGASLGSSNTVAVAAKDNVPIPFVLKTNFDIEDNTASFDVTLTSRLNARSLENVVVELSLGEGATAIKCIASRGTGGLGRGGIGSMDMGIGASNGAAWAFDSRKRVLKWEIANAPPSSSWNLRGSFSTQSKMPRPSHALHIRYEIQSHTYSSLKVEQLKITGEAYKPYKGVRGRAIGNVEWRW